MWLPPREELSISLSLEEGCYDHPVVILSDRVEDGKVVILIVRTLPSRYSS
jgi:hypothetical protein